LSPTDISNAYLIVSTQVYPIKVDTVNIGRNLDNHLVIAEPTVSRVHAQIKFEDGQFMIYDLHSTGGTYVNGKQVDKSVLHSGDTILLADTPVIFVHNAPQMSERAKAETGPLEEGEKSRESTDPKEQLDWRPKE